MKVVNPRELLDALDYDRFKTMTEMFVAEGEKIHITEPSPVIGQKDKETKAVEKTEGAFKSLIQGAVQRFEDHIDTDGEFETYVNFLAIIPAEFMPGTSDQDLGTHCFQYVRPEFRSKAAKGSTIVVAGVGFGSGSSREEAPRALKGCGIQAVIAKSYAYIYGRNQPNMALLGVIVKDEDFYTLAQEDAHVTLDIPGRTVKVQGRSFPFELSAMEEKMISGGGVTELYAKYGRQLFRKAIEQAAVAAEGPQGCMTKDPTLAW